MADVIFEWVGNAPPVAQVWSFEVAQTTADEEFSITINSKTITAVASGTDQREQIVDDLVAQWNANPYPECAAAIASKTQNATAEPFVITFTASTPGVPFDLTTGGNITTFGTKVENSGPNVWGVAENYQNMSTGAYALPGLTDEVHIRVNRPSILYTHVTSTLPTTLLKNLRIDQAFTGTIGLPKWNPAGYNEYLPTSILQQSSKAEFGRGSGQGSSRIKWNAGNVLTNVSIYNTGSSADVDYAPLQLDNLGTTSFATIYNGTVDFFRESDGAGGLLRFKMLGGNARVLNSSGSIDMTSVDIEVGGNAFLRWDAPFGTTGGGSNQTAVIHQGRVEFGPTSFVNDDAELTLDGPCNVMWAGGNIAKLTMDHSSAFLDLSQIPNHMSETGVTVAALTYTAGRIKTGDANVTLSSVIPRGTIAASYP